MYHDFAPKLAQLMVDYSVSVQPGDVVYITTSIAAEPLARALYAAILEAGGHPVLDTRLPGLGEIFFDKANDEQLGFVDPRFPPIVEAADIYMVLMADTNTKAMSSVDPTRIAKNQQAMQDVIKRWSERMDKGEMRYGLCLYPTNAAAQDAEMGLLAYCSVHMDVKHKLR